MRLDQFSGLTAFLRVAEYRSFTRAAAELGVAPASERGGQGFGGAARRAAAGPHDAERGVTEAGAAYLARVRPAAEKLEAAGAALRDAREQPAGTLRLNLPWVAGPLLIEPLIGPFLAAYPDVRLDLTFDNNFVDIAADGFDAGVRVGERVEKDMIGVRLGGKLARSVLGSPDYLARHGTPARPADLAMHQCIGYRIRLPARLCRGVFRKVGTMWNSGRRRALLRTRQCWPWRQPSVDRPYMRGGGAGTVGTGIGFTGPAIGAVLSGV